MIWIRCLKGYCLRRFLLQVRGEMRNYLDQFYQTGNYKYDYVSFGDGMRAQGFDAGGGQYIAGADTHSDNMASSSVSTRLAGETTLSSAVKLQKLYSYP